MFEPLSALAVLGFAIGALGFVGTTISRIDERVKEFREIESLLRSFRWELQDRQVQLDTWRWTWIGETAFSDETYIHFWGEQGFQDVKSRFQGILDLCQEIGEILRHPESDQEHLQLRPSELREWSLFTNNGNTQLPLSARSGRVEVEFVRKIAFSLFNNNALKEKISRLTKHVQGLEDFSQRILRLRQQIEPSRSVTRSELRDLAQLKTLLDQFASVASSLYTASCPSQRAEGQQHLDWAVEMCPPKKGQILTLWKELDNMYIDFLIRRATNIELGRIAKRIRVYTEQMNQQLEGPDRASLVAQAVSDVIMNEGVWDCHPQRRQYLTLLEELETRSRPVREMLLEGIYLGKDRKSFDLERADLIYGLAHWFLLLWNTPWCGDLCTCGILYVASIGRRTQHSFKPDPNRNHCGAPCHPPQLAQQKLRLLGIAIAELTLAAPVSVEVEGNEISYEVKSDRFSRRGLLTLLREKFGRTTLAKAVEYCLETPDPATALQPEKMMDYCQNIILPLEKYHRAIHAHCSIATSMRLQRRATTLDFSELDIWHDSD